ncbi:MAG: hypothetical protein ACE5KM_17340 [Planctomycetaceae bacterium]
MRRVNRDFIPVALKAGLVNNPPRGPEGLLYREIGRSKPAPQGICVANSAGKVLDWVLMFDDDKSVVRFLDHTLARFKKYPDAKKRVPAERFMRFPSRKMADVKDTTGAIAIPPRHTQGRCPGKPGVRKGTLVGRIIGRALDSHGKPVKDTIRQEHYMEARFEVPVGVQKNFATALRHAGDKPFTVADDLSRALVQPAFLGQLDVHPLGDVPGSKNDSRDWKFSARRIATKAGSPLRVHLTGKSSVAGGPDLVGKRKDGRRWEHEVKLTWEAYLDVDLKARRITRIVAVAHGNERLRWGNRRLNAGGEPAVRHLPAGHPINLNCGVRYGLLAVPAPKDEVVAMPATQRGGQPELRGIQAKMKRLQAVVKRRQANGGDLSAIRRLMMRFGQLMQQRKPIEAEALLDGALILLEPKSKSAPRKNRK